MDVRILNKIPLIKIKYKRTEERLFGVYGKNYCIVFSESTELFKKGDEWTPHQNKAEIRTFKEWYEETKHMKREGIIYYIVRV